MKLKLLFMFFITSYLSACAYKEYDPKNPSDYAQYWCDPKHKKMGILKPYSKEPEDRLVKTSAEVQQSYERCMRDNNANPLLDNNDAIPEPPE